VLILALSLIVGCALDSSALAPGGEPGADAAADTMVASDSTADAPAPDTSASDSTVPDATTDTGTPPVDTGPDAMTTWDCASAIFCDGFDDTSLPPWADLSVEGAGSVGQSSSEAYRGARSCRSQISNGTDRASAVADTLGAISSGTLYLRAWYYLPSADTLTDVAFAILQEGAPPWHHVSFSATTGNNNALWVDGPDVQVRDTTSPIPRDTWFCLQVQIDVDDSAGAVTSWIDGVVSASATDLDTRPGAGYSLLLVGIPWSTGAQGPFTLYTDEVAVDTSPIPCDP